MSPESNGGRRRRSIMPLDGLDYAIWTAFVIAYLLLIGGVLWLA